MTNPAQTERTSQLLDSNRMAEKERARLLLFIDAEMILPSHISHIDGWARCSGEDA